jgi:hypothetical protein
MTDITRMVQRHGESELEFWRRKVAADGDVIVTERSVRVLHRDGETQEEYSARLQALAPPISERQRDAVRAALREYWSIVRARLPWRGAERRILVDRRAHQFRIKGPDRRKHDRRARLSLAYGQDRDNHGISPDGL